MMWVTHVKKLTLPNMFDTNKDNTSDSKKEMQHKMQNNL
jgi:hypothetical protein